MKGSSSNESKIYQYFPAQLRTIKAKQFFDISRKN